MEEITVAESKALQLRLVMAEWKQHRIPPEDITTGRIEGPLTGPNHGQIGEVTTAMIDLIFSLCGYLCMCM